MRAALPEHSQGSTPYKPRNHRRRRLGRGGRRPHRLRDAVAGYDTEECIQKAADDGDIEVYYLNLYGDREYDVYRLTAKGRRASDRHMSGVFKRSAVAARRIQEEYEEMRRSGRDGFVQSR